MLLLKHSRISMPWSELRMLIDGCPYPALLADAQGAMLRCNRLFAEETAIVRECKQTNETGLTLADCGISETVDSLWQRYWIESNKNGQSQLCARCEDGSYVEMPYSILRLTVDESRRDAYLIKFYKKGMMETSLIRRFADGFTLVLQHL